MRSSTVNSLVGTVMLGACAIGGIISAYALSGAGICGFPLTRRIVISSFAAALILPAGTVGVFPKPWWLASLVFSGMMAFPMLIGALTSNWLRDWAALGCVAVAFGAAWLCRSRRIAS